MKRKNYIDNLRWMCIILLIPFHASMAWNTWEDNYILIDTNKLISSMVILINSFYMPLLFTLAGMSMRYALQKRSYLQFTVERIKKLLIPLISGVLTVVAVMTFYADKLHNQYSGSFFKHYSVFFGSISDMTGYDGKFTPGHLWFLLFLFVDSILLLLVVIAQRKWAPSIDFSKCRILTILALVIIPIIFSFVLNFNGKSIGESFAFVVLGYYFFSEDDVIKKLIPISSLFLVVTVCASIAYTIIFVWFGMHDAWICSVLAEVGKWFGILGLLGCGKKFLDFNNRFTQYMTENSFAIYIIHFVWVVVLQYYLSMQIKYNGVIYILSIIGAYILTVCTLECIRRIPGIRFLFGMKKKI